MTDLCIDEKKTLNVDRLAKTLIWFQKARPAPDDKSFHSQLGCHFEEVVEMLDCLTPNNIDTEIFILRAREAVHQLANHLKAYEGVVRIQEEDRVELLDAICDQIVTGVGVAHTANLNVCGGLDEVNRSNFSKFSDTGEPIRCPATDKVLKGPDYEKADLSRFV